MNSILTLAIDDEPLALDLISGYINRTPFLKLAGAFDNPVSAYECLRNEPVQLAIVDIQMPDLLGTDFVRSLVEGPKVIFATAHEKYALEGYKLDAVDYLLKPFSYEEFLSAVTKAKKRVELELKATVRIDTNDKFLFIKSDYKIRRIEFSSILYIEGMRDYVKIFLKDDPKPILSLNSLKTLESKLPSSRFMRIHRSFIVNLEQIETIERSRIVFGRTQIPVSDPYKVQFQQFLDENFI